MDWGLEIKEDRDNFDYLYLRRDLAEMTGKKYHKKRNLIAQFNRSFVGTEKPLTVEVVKDAMHVLETWRAERDEPGDFYPAMESLELITELNLAGSIYYADGNPAAWCLGEPVAQGRSFAVHFGKALDTYKGVHQYMTQCFASSLGDHFTYINFEEDLGDEGLRHSKMSYRPAGFVKKYIGSI